MNRLSDADRVLIAFVLSLIAMVVCRHNGSLLAELDAANKIMLGCLCGLAQQQRKD
jgi:hypothetical protein